MASGNRSARRRASCNHPRPGPCRLVPLRRFGALGGRLRELPLRPFLGGDGVNPGKPRSIHPPTLRLLRRRRAVGLGCRAGRYCPPWRGGRIIGLVGSTAHPTLATLAYSSGSRCTSEIRSLFTLPLAELMRRARNSNLFLIPMLLPCNDQVNKLKSPAGKSPSGRSGTTLSN